MSLGKDSIQKRVAKPAEAAKKAPAKKPTSTKKGTVKVSVVTNIAPETVEKVVAHKETAPVLKFGLGEDLPYYLL